MSCFIESAAESNNHLYIGKAIKNGKHIHVLGMQARIQCLSTYNAFIIPFPTNKKMGPDNIIDTNNIRFFMSEILESSKVKEKINHPNFAPQYVSNYSNAKCSMVFAENVSKIQDSMGYLEELKRPTITDEYLKALDTLYPNHTFGVCPWKGSIQYDATLIWYEPTDPNVLFVPTMTAKQGLPLSINSENYIDYSISAGMAFEADPAKPGLVYYTDKPTRFQEQFLPTNVFSRRFYGPFPNGDMFIDSKDLLSGNIPSIKHLDQSHPMTGWSNFIYNM